ncbi:hypothetical protein V490_08603 [Pseudogymnoascus sp. VKM F-3557]|nr:hypothetical protein V490_08603 [Pseudogymnoascus sp. VKM F-3557]
MGKVGSRVLVLAHPEFANHLPSKRRPIAPLHAPAWFALIPLSHILQMREKRSPQIFTLHIHNFILAKPSQPTRHTPGSRLKKPIRHRASDVIYSSLAEYHLCDISLEYTERRIHPYSSRADGPRRYPDATLPLTNQDLIPSISLPEPRPSNLPHRPGTKRIEARLARGVRAKLRSYRMARQLRDAESTSPFPGTHSSQGSSSASRTFPPALSVSEASYATSRSEYTVVWSQQDGSNLPEPTKKALCSVMKTRKALIRYMGSCLGDCRKRKVKCSLTHYALEDILDGEHDEQNEADVQWALTYESEAKGAGPLSGAHPIKEEETREEQKSSILQNINNAANTLDIHTIPENIYPSTINEGDFEDPLLEPEELARCAPPHPSDALRSFDPLSMPQQQFSTLKTGRAYSLAMEIEVMGPDRLLQYRYLCLCDPEICQGTFNSPRELLDHTGYFHPGFVPLAPDPMRLVCPDCLAFYAERSDSGNCPNMHCFSEKKPIVNIYGELYLADEVSWLGDENTLTGSMVYGTYDSSFY